jgi:hypothetical protein
MPMQLAQALPQYFCRLRKKGGDSRMKIEFPLMATLLLIGTTLLARAQAQGIEQALLATVMEYGAGGVSSVMRLLPTAVRTSR